MTPGEFADLAARIGILEHAVRRLLGGASGEATQASIAYEASDAWKARALAAEKALTEAPAKERARIAQWHRRWAAYHAGKVSKWMGSGPLPAAVERGRVSGESHAGLADVLEKNELREP